MAVSAGSVISASATEGRLAGNIKLSGFFVSAGAADARLAGGVFVFGSLRSKSSATARLSAPTGSFLPGFFISAAAFDARLAGRIGNFVSASAQSISFGSGQLTGIVGGFLGSRVFATVPDISQGAGGGFEFRRRVPFDRVLGRNAFEATRFRDEGKLNARPYEGRDVNATLHARIRPTNTHMDFTASTIFHALSSDPARGGAFRVQGEHLGNPLPVISPYSTGPFPLCSCAYLREPFVSSR